MTRSLLVALALLLGPAVLPCQGQEPAPAENAAAQPETPAIDGWGVVSNPAGDCQFDAAEGHLVILVPGSNRPHDLSVELGSSTAPTVTQSAAGDFVLQVKVDGTFAPGGVSTQAGRTGYMGAGLVVFADQRNFVRLERATLNRAGGPEVPYANFEIRVEGRLQRIGRESDLPIAGEGPTWLRLERRGGQLHGAVSQDGTTWKQADPKDLTAPAWNGPDVRAGVAAISTSRNVFTPRFSDLTLRRGAATPGPLEAPRPDVAARVVDEAH